MELETINRTNIQLRNLEEFKMSIAEMNEIETKLREHNVYIISSVEGKGNHIGRFKGFAVDADGDLIIETDIDELSCTS